jgi:FdhD protein
MPVASSLSPSLPRLTQAHAALTRQIDVVNEHGVREQVSIPAERALTVYVDKREIVTLMTLGAHPELLVLGYLRNQRLVGDVREVESITVDWEAGEDGAGVAAVKTHQGIADIAARTEKWVVTTGCGQGSVFGDLMGEIDTLVLPDACISQARLYGLLNAIRLQESTYKSAGSVHGCALFSGEQMQIFVEDVGRHNAIDTIAGWMWMNEVVADADSIFYTTGRLTSEMVMKSAQMGVAVVVSRSGITQMGYDVATRLQLCTIGRATNKHFLGYTALDRLQLDPTLAVGGVHKVANA